MRRIGDDRSEVAQPVHSLDVGSDGLCEFPPGTDVCGQLTGRERCHPAMVDLTQSGVVAGSSRRLSEAKAPVITDQCARTLPLRRRGIALELCESGLEVVEVEHDDRRDPLSALISTTPTHSDRNASGLCRGPRRARG